MIFVDTCILIDYSKDKIDIDLSSSDYCINSIVELEFKVGALNKRELKKIKRILSQIQSISVNQDILDLANKLLDKYVLSHNMGIYDAIIASTSLMYNLPLWTYNKKDFRYIEELELYER